MNIDEESLIILILVTPLPFLVYTIKTNPALFIFSILIYILLGTAGPLYFQGREQGVYRKANLICWLKIAGSTSFTPRELEILNKALGKERSSPIKKAPHPLLKRWKIIFLTAVLLSSVSIWFLVPSTDNAEAAIPEREIKFIDISVNKAETVFCNRTVQPRQVLYATLALKIPEDDKVFLSSVEVYNSTGHLIGKDYFGLTYTDYTKGVFTLKAIFTDATITWQGNINTEKSWLEGVEHASSPQKPRIFLGQIKRLVHRFRVNRGAEKDLKNIKSKFSQEKREQILNYIKQRLGEQAEYSCRYIATYINKKSLDLIRKNNYRIDRLDGVIQKEILCDIINWKRREGKTRRTPQLPTPPNNLWMIQLIDYMADRHIDLSQKPTEINRRDSYGYECARKRSKKDKREPLLESFQII